jgi:hypothetical protein
MIKREIVAACMESQLYYTMPLPKRLQLVKQIEERSFYSNLRAQFLSWVKTGQLNLRPRD